jgi:hypothetical protein
MLYHHGKADGAQKEYEIGQGMTFGKSIIFHVPAP